MVKIFKIITAFVLTLCLAVTTVVCCCVAPAVMAHLHKSSVCSHCPTQNSSHGHSSVPGSNCMYQLTNAEVSHGQIVSFSTPIVLTVTFFSDHHTTTPFLPSAISAYPRGSPPLTINLVPIYLRTYSLRI